MAWSVGALLTPEPAKQRHAADPGWFSQCQVNDSKVSPRRSDALAFQSEISLLWIDVVSSYCHFSSSARQALWISAVGRAKLRSGEWNYGEIRVSLRECKCMWHLHRHIGTQRWSVCSWEILVHVHSQELQPVLAQFSCRDSIKPGTKRGAWWLCTLILQVSSEKVR